MLFGSLSFSVMGSLAHALGAWCDWQVIALARSALPLVVVAAFTVAGGTPLVWWRPPTLWVRSIAGSVSMVGTFFALTRLPVSDVFTLTNMFPVWVAVLSWPVLKERPSGRVWLSVACGVAGVVMIQQPHLAEGDGTCLIALAGSFFTAIAMIGLHRLKGIDTGAIVVHFSAVALLFCVASYFVFDRAAPPESLDGQPLLLLLGVGVTATVGQWALTKAFSSGPPAKVSVVALTQVVFALAFEVFWWQRSFSPLTLLGMALVLTPTAWLLVSRR
jgi:drug/metabolite transporter (DMT)-like permease